MLWHRCFPLNWRQWVYSPEFRIPACGPEDFSALLLALLCEQERAAGPATPPAAETASDGRPAGPAPQDDALAIAICNGCFRIRRNASEMTAAASGDGREGSKELRSISRALKRMDDFLGERGIEYRDLTGQVYDPGRQDFESIGEPQEVSGLKVRTIIQIELPAILIRGKLVQRARGVVGKPAS